MRPALHSAAAFAVMTAAVLVLPACDRSPAEAVGGVTAASTLEPIDAVPSTAAVASSRDMAAGLVRRPAAAETVETVTETPAGTPSAATAASTTPSPAPTSAASTTSALNGAPNSTPAAAPPAAPREPAARAASSAGQSPGGASSGPTAPAPKRAHP